MKNCVLVFLMCGLLSACGGSGGSGGSASSTSTGGYIVSVSPRFSGSVSQSTTGQTVTLIAEGINRYTFINWTEDGIEVSTNSSYTFVSTATVTRRLVANFEKTNVVPTADAGLDKALVIGSAVSLNGRGSSDPDGDPLTYIWSFISKPDGSSAVLHEPTSVSPSFIVDVAGAYVLSLVVNDGINDSIADEITIKSATGIEGIIYSDKTLDLLNSPYVITGDIQIAHGSTLSIDPNVEVFGNDRAIKVFGILDINGQYNSLVKFHDVNIQTVNESRDEWFKIDIDYLEANSGSIYHGGYGSINLRNSILSKIRNIYLWYPVENSFIEKNIFINTSGISVGTDKDIKVYIRNNVFYQDTYAVSNWASYGSSETIVEFNSFLNTEKIALMLPGGYIDSTPKITAVNNFWNTSDINIIDGMIYDKNDDLSSSDFIVYSPFLISPHEDTPDVTSFFSE
jgi:hypothetical protein